MLNHVRSCGIIAHRLRLIGLFVQFLPHRTPLAKLMHSTPVSHDYTAMQVRVLPALGDNYMYLLIDNESKEAAIVDPVDPDLVLSQAEAANVNITTILTTHHHYDHAGGNVDLVKKMKNSVLRVVGGDDRRIPALSVKVRHNDELSVGSLKVRCLETPCHTTSHICYFVTSPLVSHPVVFTGDTLFIAGCGRFFEGTAEQMDTALNKRLGALPDDTKVYCGHEYTQKNLEFAKKVDPQNEHVEAKLQAVVAVRSSKVPTVPSTIGEEKNINPFMRVHCREIQCFANKTERNDVMQAVRAAKDKF